LAGAGALVAILGRNTDRGEACAARIRDEGGSAAFFIADATDPASLSQAHLAIQGGFGSPTVLLSAAGGNDASVTVADGHPFEEIKPADWRANFEMNLVGGALLPAQEFGPAMCESGRGSIINIASVSAHLPLSRVVTYSAAKAAVLNLSQFLAREWAPRGVRVNTITPGFFPAEQNRRLLYDESGKPTARAQSILGHTPMGRFGQPSELVGAAIFLASSAASGFVTGADLRVDGGFLSQTI
jgi:NAD(P)-dependent dehydrogenase (short-subunit alcohol dehydrogenase family)